MPDGLFLIGTNREVGKTLVGAGLVVRLRARCVKTVLMTPIYTGGSVESAKSLREAIDVPDLESRLLNSIRFETLASPHVASQVEHARTEPDLLVSAFRKLVDMGFFVVVSGCGAMVQSDHDFFILDLLKEMESHGSS